MSDRRNTAFEIRVLLPGSDDYWDHAEALIAELQEWDIQQSKPLGLERDEVIGAFYPDTVDEIRQQSAPPDGCFAIALDSGTAAGCAGFRRLSSGACELLDVYVRPDHRGRGIASTLLRYLLRQAGASGYETMRLETASFMLTAHGLYRSLNFQARAPYRSIPARFADVTLWMECRLTSYS